MAFCNKIKAKLAQQDKPFIWMGYAKYHKAGAYRLYNKVTGKNLPNRDVIFMHKTFHEYEKDNVLKPHEKYDDKTSSPKSMEDKDDDGDEDSDAIYAKNTNVSQ